VLSVPDYPIFDLFVDLKKNFFLGQRIFKITQNAKRTRFFGPESASLNHPVARSDQLLVGGDTKNNLEFKNEGK